jgi:hypothetical protein
MADMRLLVGPAMAFYLLACDAVSLGNQQNNETASSKAGARATPDGPFGIALGATVQSVPGLTRREDEGLYSTRNPPVPHPDFEEIAVVAYPDAGICTVRGIGRQIENDASGITVRSAIDGLADALSTKYGTPERLDACSGGDIACESQFWMMTLLQGQRTYGARWETQNDTMRRNRIGSIYLVASAPSINSSAVLIEYHSSNRRACEAAERRERASAL